MALNIEINFENTYEDEIISQDLRATSFVTSLEDQTNIPLHIKISSKPHELLPAVYNLAFGPKRNGQIDDSVELHHADYSKVFSTILFHAFTYLTGNPGHAVGIDGSTNSRAYLYYRTFQRNYDYLNQHFEVFGLKYYVRITRFGKTQYDNPFDFSDVIPKTLEIRRGIRVNPESMFNYFIFKLKN